MVLPRAVGMLDPCRLTAHVPGLIGEPAAESPRACVAMFTDGRQFAVAEGAQGGPAVRRGGTHRVELPGGTTGLEYTQSTSCALAWAQERVTADTAYVLTLRANDGRCPSATDAGKVIATLADPPRLPRPPARLGFTQDERDERFDQACRIAEELPHRRDAGCRRRGRHAARLPRSCHFAANGVSGVKAPVPNVVVVRPRARRRCR